MTAANHLEELRAQARYRRERLELYRAKVHGPRPSSPARLEALAREYELAVSTLERAESDARSAAHARAVSPPVARAPRS